MVRRVLRIQPKPKTWQEIYDQYPKTEPELTPFLIRNAPYKYYKILMSGKNVGMDPEECREWAKDLYERIIQNIFWFGPFTEEMIAKRLFYLVDKGLPIDPFNDRGNIFLQEIPYLEWTRVYYKWYWLLRWYN